MLANFRFHPISVCRFRHVLGALSFIFVVTAVGCRTSGSALTESERVEIELAVEARFSEIADATNKRELDRLRALYVNDEGLTYTARGRIYRGRAQFDQLVNAQLGGLARAELSFTDVSVDVLGRGVAVVTAGFRFAATTLSGDSGESSGSYTCVFVLADGEWTIRHSSHTFPTDGA